jgi:putative membrane-bound dehydrogenase-like protein
MKLLFPLFLTVALASSLHAADAPPSDIVPFAGLSPQDACDKATLPPGFKMNVFAAEPDVVQPIAFCLDHRGRIWVAEGITYPKRHGNPPVPVNPSEKPTPEQLKDIFGGADRILVLEDTNGDHKFDKKTVFMEHLNLVSGLQVGFGGVWIGAAPYLMFVPFTDGDAPKPSGDPQILLDGWNYNADTHETLNTFTWGPDGWLYGCHGVFCPSNPGKPGTPAKNRQWTDAGVWRYHPTRHVFETFTEGGSNPWGIDFDEHGQLFAEMCVIPHFWHMIQGARIERQGGQHFAVGTEENARMRQDDGKPVNPYIYEDIKQHGDHVHWAGAGGPHAGNARSDAAGGGHAHAGVMVYQGESWPAEYRGKIFMGNIHGQRFNMDIPVPTGSGFVGKHGKDFLNFNDTWSQTLNQTYDQDGSVYTIDWYDKNQCHNTREDGHDRSNGRIYKIVYHDQKTTQPDLAAKSDLELAKLVGSRNEFFSRHARQLLQERAAQKKLSLAAIEALRSELRDGEPAAALRALWALDVTGNLDADAVSTAATSPDEWLRGWAIQVGFEDPAFTERIVAALQDAGADPMNDLLEMARNDPSPVVRRFIASTVQRIRSVDLRTDLVKALLAHGEDADDHNLPLMYWFALEPLVGEQPASMLALAAETKIPRLLNFTTRRIASIGSAETRALIARSIAAETSVPQQIEMLRGLAAALQGQRSVTMPPGWDAVETALGNAAQAELRTLVQTLSLTFGSQRALTSLQATLTDAAAPAEQRRAALDSLLGTRDAALPGLLRPLLTDTAVRGPALRALAAYDDDATPTAILDAYGTFSGGEKRDALNTLVSRSAFARPLLAALEAGKVAKSDVTADVLRQLRAMKDPKIQKGLETAFGHFREVSADKKAQIEKYRGIYYAGGSTPGNASSGRVVFNRVCVQCHTLFDTGGKVGPDITGSNRGDLNYLLENVVDPNAVIPNEYRVTEIETKDGRMLTGILKIMGDQSVLLQTANELVTIPRNEIASRTQSENSMMPEGLLDGLKDQEVRDLIYYLGRPGQTALPADAK